MQMNVGLCMASLLEKYGWHEWLCHSNFSFLQGASFPDEFVEQAHALGYSGLGITDFDGVYGIVRAYRARKKLKLNSSFQLTYGAELHLQPDHHLPTLLQDTLVLKAISHQGYHHLCAILSLAHKERKYDAYISIDHLFSADRGDLLAIISMRGLASLCSPEKIYQRCAQLKEIFGESLYVALGRYSNPAEDHWLPVIYQVSRKLSIPCLLTQDPFMHQRERRPLADVLQAIKRRCRLEQAAAYLWPNAEHVLRPLAQIEKDYGQWPFYAAALKASRALREAFCFDLDQLRYHYPQEMIPDGLSAQDFLQKLVWEKAQDFYHGRVPEQIKATLEKELRLVEALRFADYFLTVWDIVAWARGQNILCQGRGSAANSAICFVLGITSVNPQEFELLSERFISMERGDPPDIDVDFEHERREEVIQYIYERYGRGRAAMVANVISFKSRGALRFVGQALGASPEVLETLTRLMRQKHEERRNYAAILQLARAKHPQEKLGWELWAKMAEMVHGFPRHLGIHCGGFLVTEKSLNWFVPQEPATMENRTVVTWCKEDIEALGFFKIDVLSLGMLTAIRKCFAYVREHYGVQHELARLPRDDAPTYAMLQKGDTVGTFQVESRAQMAMLPRLRPKNFYDIAIEVGIVRPGPLQGGFVHPYLKRRDGKEQVHYAHPLLRPILERTLGIPIFQEQIMRVAMAVGGFDPGEADELRRQMGAWQFKGDLAPLVKRLAHGMRERGIDEVFVDQILRQVRGFAEYGFPESHAISFAFIAYASCFLRCHYLPAFTLAVLNSQPMGFYSPHALLEDARRHGVAILPVCMQRSTWDHQLEANEDKEAAHPFAIRLGMRLVKGVRKAAVDGLVAARQDGWQDEESFWRALGRAPLAGEVTRRDLSCLAAAGAFACFGQKRREAIWQSAALPYDSPLRESQEQSEFAEETPWQRIKNDFSSLQTSMHGHPTKLLRERYWRYPLAVEKLVLAQQLAKEGRGRLVYVFGLVLVRQAPPSAKGMVFITMEDETGFFNLVISPDIYRRAREVLGGQGFLCVRGQLQSINEGHSLKVTEVLQPQEYKAKILPLAAASAANTPIGNAALNESELNTDRYADDLTDTRNFY